MTLQPLGLNFPRMLKTGSLSLHRDQWERMTAKVHCAEPGCPWVGRGLNADDAENVLAEHLQLAHGWRSES